MIFKGADGKISGVKILMITAWLLSFLFLALMIWMKYRFDKSLNTDIINFAKGIFSVGDPASVAGYIINEMSKRRHIREQASQNNLFGPNVKGQGEKT